jgi:uncharacterized protein
MLPLDWILLAATALVASLTQAAVGFGFAIMAVPFFLLILESVTAIQVTIILTLAISLVLVWRLWRTAPRGLLLRLIAGTAAGFPIGIFAYLHAGLTEVKVTVAVLIVGFTTYLFFSRRGNGGEGPLETRPAADVAVGVVSGIMATGLGMPGPSLLIYLSYVGADKVAARSLALTLFTFSYGGGLILQAVVVGISVETWRVSAILVPLVLLGTFLGHKLSRHLSQRMFHTAVLAILACTGLYMLAVTLFV